MLKKYCLSLFLIFSIIAANAITPTIHENEFSWKAIQKNYPTSENTLSQRNEAITTFEVIDQENAWTKNLSSEDITEFPIGIKHTSDDGSTNFALGFTKAIFHKDYTELTAFVRAELPQTDNNGDPITLFFGANNIKLSHDGGLLGEANLVLLGDVNIPFNAGNWLLSLKGGLDYTTGRTENLTYVTIGCDGVQEIGIEGIVAFSRKLILPVDAQGNADTANTDHRVEGNFSVVGADWNDLLVKVDLSPFTLSEKRNSKDYKGNFMFAVNTAVLDFSDLRNDSAIEFPNHYHDNGLLMPSPNAWRGVYINSFTVALPEEFKTTESIDQDNRVSFEAKHLLIDNYGVSGNFIGNNLFTLDEGRTNDEKAWAYSVDRIELNITSNRFVKAKFSGELLLPISKKKTDDTTKTSLAYQGLISQEEYMLNVTSTEEIDFDLWQAKGKLLPNSSVEFKVVDQQFRPKANLHGTINIVTNKLETDTSDNAQSSQEPQKLIDFKGIEFQNLVLQTEAPIFQVDYMGYKGNLAIAGFPISVSKIGVTSTDDSANLHLDVAMNLMGGNNGFAAKTQVNIIGQFSEKDYKQQWNFQQINLGRMAIDANLGSFTTVSYTHLTLPTIA